MEANKPQTQQLSFEDIKKGLDTYIQESQKRLDTLFDEVKKEAAKKMLQTYEEGVIKAQETYRKGVEDANQYKTIPMLYEPAIKSCNDSLKLQLDGLKNILGNGLKSIGL